MNITRIKCTGKHGPEEFRNLYKRAYDVGDPNKENYNETDAKLSWRQWIYFYSIQDVMFCGMRDYGKFARIFDRFFIFLVAFVFLQTFGGFQHYPSIFQK